MTNKSSRAIRAYFGRIGRIRQPDICYPRIGARRSAGGADADHPRWSPRYGSHPEQYRFGRSDLSYRPGIAADDIATGQLVDVEPEAANELGTGGPVDDSLCPAPDYPAPGPAAGGADCCARRVQNCRMANTGSTCLSAPFRNRVRLPKRPRKARASVSSWSRFTASPSRSSCATGGYRQLWRSTIQKWSKESAGLNSNLVMSRSGESSTYGELRVTRPGSDEPVFMARGIAIYSELAETQRPVRPYTRTSCGHEGSVAVRISRNARGGRRTDRCGGDGAGLKQAS